MAFWHQATHKSLITNGKIKLIKTNLQIDEFKEWNFLEKSWMVTKVRQWPYPLVLTIPGLVIHIYI